MQRKSAESWKWQMLLSLIKRMVTILKSESSQTGFNRALHLFPAKIRLDSTLLLAVQLLMKVLVPCGETIQNSWN
jgi:gentisate 1,2-dioxygenase